MTLVTVTKYVVTPELSPPDPKSKSPAVTPSPEVPVSVPVSVSVSVSTSPESVDGSPVSVPSESDLPSSPDLQATVKGSKCHTKYITYPRAEQVLRMSH